MIDCLIVGGGPAGLTAATYLGRFLRDVLVIDAGESRLKRVPISRNAPGFPEGVTGLDLLERMQRQADKFGARRTTGHVERIEGRAGQFHVSTSSGPLETRTILLATGVEMKDPDLPGLDEAIADGIVRYCPICDGFEARGKRVVVLGGRKGSIAEAHFLRRYSDDLTFVAGDMSAELTEEEVRAAGKERIRLVHSRPTSLERVGDGLRITFANRSPETFEILYPCLGVRPRSDLLASLEGNRCPDGGILTGAHQETNIAGVYAAGDVLKGLDQIASACGQAAIAATAVHNWLIKRT